MELTTIFYSLVIIAAAIGLMVYIRINDKTSDLKPLYLGMIGVTAIPLFAVAMG